MSRTIRIIFVLFISVSYCYGQYSREGLIISAGTNYSRYIGKGDGQNYFKTIRPGVQLELTLNMGNGFEYIMYGVSYFGSQNVVGRNEVPVKLISPYYTEFLWFQKEKKNPFFIFAGFDIVGMRFPDMKKPDYNYNFSFGGGWNLRLTDQLFLQFKIKPYFVLDNSIGQVLGVNTIMNLHLSTR
jgi:hypothetical protein